MFICKRYVEKTAGLKLKVKRLLKFYFCVDSLERAINGMIAAKAAASWVSAGGGMSCAEDILKYTQEKDELSALWNYLDGVICSLKKDEAAILENYALMRCGIARLCDERRKEIKRAAMKFRRRAHRLLDFSGALALVGKYYCLLR